MKHKHIQPTSATDITQSAAPGPSASALPTDSAAAIPSDSIQVFNFREHWDQVKPHLPAAEHVMTECMNTYVADSGDEGDSYDPKDGPWKYDSNWRALIHHKVLEAVDRGEFEWQRPPHGASREVADKTWREYWAHAQQFSPKPDTFDWYEVGTASYYIAPWLIALGKEMFPQFIWVAFYYGSKSFAGGIDTKGRLRMIFDMRSENVDVNELLRSACEKQHSEECGHRHPRPASKPLVPSLPPAELQRGPGSTQVGGTGVDGPKKDATLVQYNGLTMPENERNKIEAAQTQPTFDRQGVSRERIRYGEEVVRWGASKRPCHGCRVIKGQIHVFGCDVEECPFCGDQAFICGCGLEIPEPSRAK
jgi:hypothetical protein